MLLSRGMGFLLWASAIVGFLSPTYMGHSASVFSRYREGRSSIHGAIACNYSPISTRVISLNCGFANGSKATGLDSLAVEAGGSHARGRLSFKRAFSALLGLQKRPAALFGTETISLPFHSLSPVISPFTPRASRWQSTGRHSGAGDYLSLRLLKYSIYSFPQTSSSASAFRICGRSRSSRTRPLAVSPDRRCARSVRHSCPEAGVGLLRYAVASL